MYLHQLSQKERLVISKIAKIQIKSLSDILLDNVEIDLTLWAIENEIDPKELYRETKSKLETYQGLLENPQQLLTLPGHELQTIKHILFNFLQNKKYQKTKANIWRKIMLKEEFLFSLN